jgi:peptidylprolyl isomerase
MRKILTISLCFALLAAGACTKKKTPSLAAEPSTGTAGVTVSEKLGVKPTVSIPEGDPPSTLTTSDIVIGTGTAAVEHSQVVAHYVGIAWSTKKQFDSSWDRGNPAPFGLDQVIKGWQQGIPGEKVGGRRLIVIPGALAYGASPPPGSGIGANETLVFVVDLMDVQPPPAPPKPGNGGVTVTGAIGSKPKVVIPSGPPPTDFLYQDVVVGTGAESVAHGTVVAHYVGIAWSTKKQFDASWDRGDPTTFGLDQVIKGWQQGIPGEKVGGRRLLVIPGALAYGASPPASSGIGPNETLVFVVDLTNVQ